VLVGVAVAALLVAVIYPANGIARLCSLIAIAAIILGALWMTRESTRLTASLASASSSIEQLESEGKRYRQTLYEIADGIEVAILIVDGRGRIEYLNRKGAEIFRFANPQGRELHSVTLSNELDAMVRAAGLSSRMQVQEVNLRFPEERVALAQVWKVSPDSAHVYISIYDITELKRLERARRDFVANVSHELRTPMTTIRAMAETLHDGDDEDYELLGKRYLGKIIAEVDRLTLIAQDLLTLSAAEGMSRQTAPMDLGQVVASTVAQLQPKAEAKNLKLSYSGVPSLPMEGNDHQLSQVVMNLVENAIKYSNTGTIDVNLVMEEGQARLAVTDTGIGIPEEHLDRIFERFYRVDKGRSRSTGGTGLGLAIVRHITEAHGGRVAVRSMTDHGTTFTVILPLA
jgi:two-component system phosphate regulon sensor histidine kinase PhoR